MFLSYATVPMFAFTILLSFILLHYSPIESTIDDKIYDSCAKCLESTCAEIKYGKCIGCENSTDFFCLYCDIINGNNQFISEQLCKTGCTDEKMTCVCDDTCYACVPKEGLDMSKFAKCNVLSDEVLDTKCIGVPT